MRAFIRRIPQPGEPKPQPPLGQREIVLQLLGDREWHSVRDLAWRARRDHGIAYCETGLSARIRELRRPEHGGHPIEGLRVPGGHSFVYRLR